MNYLRDFIHFFSPANFPTKKLLCETKYYKFSPDIRIYILVSVDTCNSHKTLDKIIRHKKQKIEYIETFYSVNLWPNEYLQQKNV